MLTNQPGNKVPSSPDVLALKADFFELYFSYWLKCGDPFSGVNVKLLAVFGSLKGWFLLLFRSEIKTEIRYEVW